MASHRIKVLPAIHGAWIGRIRPRGLASPLTQAFVAISILSMPLIAVALWYMANARWPSDDASNYMSTAVGHFLALKERRILQGLAAIYWDRGWRPVAFPTLAVPALWLTNGNVLAAAAAVQLSALMLWLSYAYAIARQSLSHIPAAIAAVLVCTTSALASSLLVFFAEAVWLALVTAFIHHAIKTNGFRSAGHACAAGLYFGLAGLIRPAESLATLALAALIFFGTAVRRRHISWSDVGVAAAQVALILGGLGAAAFVPWMDRWTLWPLAGGTVFAAATWARRSASQGAVGLVLFVSVAAIVNVLWWADFMPNLYSWVHDTSFGLMAQVTELRSKQLGFSGALAWMQALYFAPATLVVIGLAAAAPASLWLCRLRPPHRLPALLFFIAISAVAPVILLYGMTGTSDPRRLAGGVSLLILTAGIASQCAGPFRRLRSAVVGTVAVAQVAVVFAAGCQHDGVRSAFAPLVGSLPTPDPRPDANRDVVVELLNLGVPRGSSVAVYTMALHQAAERIWEPGALSLAARTLGDPIWITYLWDAGDYHETLERYRASNVRYLLLDLYRDQSNAARHQPTMQFAVNLLDRLEADQVITPGLRELARFRLRGREQVLFEIVPI